MRSCPGRSFTLAARRKRFPPNNVQASRKPCIDCRDEGIETKRKAPHPGPRCATHHRAKRKQRSTATWSVRIWETYGITEDEYWAIYEAQGGRCYICQRATGVRKRLSVDHCHETGIVRGLLDTACNRNVLGHLRDDPEAFQRAINYLKKPPATEVIGWRPVPSTGAPVKANTRKRAGAKPTTTDGGDTVT